MASSSVKSFIADPYNDKSLRDYQHASRIMATNSMRLAPKSKFNFYVVFSINPGAADPTFIERHSNEINLLVKSFELPKYTVKIETVNQYNRRKLIQTKHEQHESSVVFHDDNYGVSRMLWENYYKHYFSDPTSAQNANGAYSRSAMKNFDANGGARYGYDTGHSVPFFSKITLYQMGIHMPSHLEASAPYHGWNSYTLVNPLISSWHHDSMDYSSGNALASHSISIHCEAVAYDNGVVSNVSPPGFADAQNYDITHSLIIDPNQSKNTNIVINATK